MKNYTRIILVALLLLTPLPSLADVGSTWLRRWNSEPDRKQKLKESHVLFKASKDASLQDLLAVGFKQTDGSFLLGRVIWREKAYYPLAGFAQVLSDKNFTTQSDQEREATFLTLLQQTYGLLGTKVFTGSPLSRYDRPQRIVGNRGPDDSHRFQVWFYKFPLQTESGEWREVLYSVSADGKKVRSKTLGSYRPTAEKLRSFPRPSRESFE